MDEELLRKAIAVIERNMDNVEFSTEQFAREMNMSRSNLHLKLKAITYFQVGIVAEFIQRNDTV